MCLILSNSRYRVIFGPLKDIETVFKVSSRCVMICDGCFNAIVTHFTEKKLYNLKKCYWFSFNEIIDWSTLSSKSNHMSIKLIDTVHFVYLQKLEFEWILQKEVLLVLKQLHDILVECAHRFPVPLYGNEGKKVDKFVLTSAPEQLKVVVTLTGDAITHAVSHVDVVTWDPSRKSSFYPY